MKVQNGVKKTQEQLEIEAALNVWSEILDWQKMVLTAVAVLYLPALVFMILDNPAWIAIMLVEVALLTANFILRIAADKRRAHLNKLFNAYNRKIVQPLYNEIAERLPDFHLHLNEDSSITLTDRRKKD